MQDKLAAGSLKKEQVPVDCMIRRVLRQSYWLQIIELCKLQGVFPLICVFCNVFLTFSHLSCMKVLDVEPEIQQALLREEMRQ